MCGFCVGILLCNVVHGVLSSFQSSCGGMESWLVYFNCVCCGCLISVNLSDSASCWSVLCAYIISPSGSLYFFVIFPG